VVDDEHDIRFSLHRALTRAGYDVALASSGEEAVNLIARQPFSLVLTDIKMPGIDGLTVMRKAKELCPDTAVILLTGYATLESAIEALRQGAVDYLTKPCPERDVLQSIENGLRMRATNLRKQRLLARIEQDLQWLLDEKDLVEERPETEIRVGALVINPQRHQTLVKGQRVHLTPTEFALLNHMAHHLGQVISCRELVRVIHGEQCSEEDARRLIRPHVTNLRQKIEVDPSQPHYLRNVRGTGYMLSADMPHRA
jgi:DNA-binding response OmpR family regulator